MHSHGRYFVLIVSLCGLFNGVSSAIGDSCSPAGTCSAPQQCFGGKCLCPWGRTDISGTCTAITNYAACNMNEDCGFGTCTSDTCVCNNYNVVGERCELNSDSFILIPQSSRGVLAARFSFGFLVLMSVSGLVLPL